MSPTAPGEGGYYQDLVESSPDAILVVDEAGRIDLVNRQAEVLFGYSREELLGHSLDLLVPDRAKRVHPSRRATYFADPKTRPMGVGLDLTARRKDGVEVPVDISLSPLHTARGTMVSVAIRDVSDRKRAETALQDAYAKLSASMQDLERHDREMTLVNEMGDMLQTCLSGAEANEVISRYGRLLFASASGAVFTARPSVAVFEATAAWGAEAGVSTLQRDECWALRRSRVYAVEDADGGPTCPHVGLAPAYGYVCVPMMAQGEALGLLHVRAAKPGPEDSVTFQSQRTLALTVGEHLALAMANLTLRETLRHQSVSDPLTGLYNRRYLHDQLARELQRASTSGRPVAVVVADIDHFKQANDALGHGTGDEILRAVARTIEANVRAVDTVCRWGGDEFVLVLPDSSLDVAQQRALQLAAAVRVLSKDRDTFPPVTLSIGVAVFPDDGTTADALLRAADTAMYGSKAAGRDGVTSATTKAPARVP